MLFVFNKNKIISYLVATSIVIVLFVFSVSVIPNSDTKIVQELVGLEPTLNIFEIEEVKRKGMAVKIIHVTNLSKRVRCPICGKYYKIGDIRKAFTVLRSAVL